MSKEKIQAAEAKKEVVTVERNITDQVLGRVQALTGSSQLALPSDYSVENAMKSAWLMLQTVEDRSKNLALKTCTKESICNALLDMAVQGLNPAKKQCYFIAYGKQLQLQRSYMGTVAVAKRFSDVKDIIANVIYEGDELQYEIDVETGNRIITRHIQAFENIDITKIKGAYATIQRSEGKPYIEIMTMTQLKAAWNQSAMKPINDKGEIKSGTTHDKFTEEMAKKTVINRACKMFINTSDDSGILSESFNRTTENEYTDKQIIYTTADIVPSEEDRAITAAAEAAMFGNVKKEEDEQAQDDTLTCAGLDVEAEAVFGVSDMEADDLDE